jgi:hypothetical protein
VFKAYKKYKSESAGQLGTELEEWADSVTEGTWVVPNSQEKIHALKELLRSPVPAGMDGVDAVSTLETIIGDDSLYDAIYHLADSQGPDADTRSLIKSWINDNMPSLLNQINFGPNNADDATTAQTLPVSPKQPEPSDQYGATTMDEPNVNESNDGLDFIRSLAGICK